MADQPKKKPFSSKSRNDNRPNGKAAKKGTSRTTRSPQSALQKVLLGGGALRGITKPVAGSSDGRWKPSETVAQPFDPVQARKNRRLYPHLFPDDKPRTRR